MTTATKFRVPVERAAAYPGDKFGRIAVLGVPFYFSATGKNRKQYVVVSCECGKVYMVACECLLTGVIKSCGCGKRKHGLSHLKLYRVWGSMLRRCNDSSIDSYKNYGGRGIRVCEAWSDFVAFHDWAFASGYREGLFIDRIDNDGNYEPSNCRWVTRRESQNNTRATIFATAFGVTKTALDWANDERCVVGHKTLVARLKSGIEHHEAITRPVKETQPDLDTLTAFGVTKTVREWLADPRCVVGDDVLRSRVLRLGWSHEKSLSFPISESQTRAIDTRKKRREERLLRAEQVGKAQVATAKAKAKATPKKESKGGKDK